MAPRKSATGAPQNPASAVGSDKAPACRGLIVFYLFGGSVWTFARPALGKSAGRTVHLQDMDVVGETVEERADEARVAERGGPFVEGQVRGDDRGAALAALADQLKQQFRPGARQRHEAQFVDVEEGPWPQMRPRKPDEGSS